MLNWYFFNAYANLCRWKSTIFISINISADFYHDKYMYTGQVFLELYDCRTLLSSSKSSVKTNKTPVYKNNPFIEQWIKCTNL